VSQVPSKMRSSIALALLVAAAAPAAADDPADTDADAAALAAAKKEKKKAKDDAKRKAGDTLEVHGRVFARGAAAKEETALGAGAWTSELTLASARIGVDYQWREQVRAKLSYEAAKSSVRDAFVELDLDHGLRLRAGRMKLPVGALEQTSSWTLPTIGRGMVADAVAGSPAQARHELAGRRRVRVDRQDLAQVPARGLGIAIGDAQERQRDQRAGPGADAAGGGGGGGALALGGGAGLGSPDDLDPIAGPAQPGLVVGVAGVMASGGRGLGQRAVRIALGQRVLGPGEGLGAGRRPRRRPWPRWW
jgi:hypothetical protein